MKARALVSAVVAVILAVGVTTEALGAAKVEVTIKAKTAELNGKVSSSKEDCRRRVEVTLFWKDRGEDAFQDVRVDETTARGKYSINAPDDDVPAGKYFSKVDSKQGCKAARSETIRVRASD